MAETCLKMIAVPEAERVVLESARVFPSEDIQLTAALGRVLAEHLTADRDYPPLDRATMDGIAVNYRAWEDGRRTFPVAATAAAGAPQQALPDEAQSIEIMTGAPVPEGCDCVIPYEEFILENQSAVIPVETQVTLGQNIHAAAADYLKGDLLIGEGTRLNPAHIAVAAAAGRTRIKVTRQPKIAVIGTGNELVEIDRPVKPHQARRSNAYALEALLARHGFSQVTRYHLRDDKTEIRIGLKELLKKFDILILSGGVSKGKFDFIPEILGELHIDVLFHRVLQKPGKPFWYGMGQDGHPVFALPGNPVSTLVTAVRYVIPYLRAASGEQREDKIFLPLKNEYDNRGNLTFFTPARLVNEPGHVTTVEPLEFKGSGNYADLVLSDGFAEIPPGPMTFPAGLGVGFFKW